MKVTAGKSQRTQTMRELTNKRTTITQTANYNEGNEIDRSIIKMKKLILQQQRRRQQQPKQQQHFFTWTSLVQIFL